jgi:hypothetical protein
MFDDLCVLAVLCHGCDLPWRQFEYLTHSAAAFGCSLSTGEFEDDSTDPFVCEIREGIAML